MRKTTLILCAIILSSTFSIFSFGKILSAKMKATSLPVSVTGAAGIADGTEFETLKAAFDAINLQADQSGKDIEIKIAGSTTETASAILNQPATANWNSLTIYPTAENVSISGNFTNTLIDLNGADNVTITGKLDKTGAAKNLTLSQTENTNNASRTIRIWSDASNNNINNCIVRGSCISSGAGVIFLGDAVASGTGNDNNVIEFCDINAAGAANGIKAASGVVVASEGNIIRNNNIFDFYINNTSTTATAGIDFGTNYTSTTITGNSLYQTASREYNPSTAVIHLGINVGGASNGNVITGNFIGGSAPQCGGTAWTVTGGLYRLFTIQTSLGTTTASSFQNNTISNIDITSAFITGGNSVFTGIQHGGTGTANFGTDTGNTIGSTSSTGSIKVKFTGATTGSLVVGINIAGGNVNVSNNKIGGVIVDLNNSANRAHFYGISTAGANPISITKNIIGSETIANSIEHKGSTTLLANQSNLRGITVGNTGGSTIDENIIANLTCNSTGAGMATVGIYSNSAASNASISKNIIRNIITYSTRTSVGSTAALTGILFAGNSNGNTIGNNTIYSLQNATTTADGVESYGIFFESSNAGASTIENNKIYNISTASTSTNANIIGIFINNGLTTTRNNMIALGNGMNTAYNMSGIRKSNAKNNNFYHNTIVLSGTEIGTAGTTNTYAFYKTGSGTDVVKNNIFINNRSNAAGNTQKHYAVYLNDLTTFTSDYNVVNFTGTGGLLGAVGTTNYATGPEWQTATNQDLNSEIAVVNFTNAAAGDLTIAGASVKDFDLRVPFMSAVTNDILNSVRNTKFTYAGAHEAALPFIYKTMQGTYTVGSTATSDFSTLSEAVNAVNDALAINGDIVFEITSDITEPANFGLAKDLGSYKLTIRPDADVLRTITFTQATTNTAGIKGHFLIGYKNLTSAKDNQNLVAANNVTIDGTTNKNLKFTTANASLASSIIINVVGGSNGTTIKNCIFDTQSTATVPACIGITQYLNAPADASPSNILIENNEIKAIPLTSVNGTGIICDREGSATTTITNLKIKNNLFVVSGKAVEINYSSGADILGNEFKIQRGTGTGIAYGVYLRGKSGDMNVVGNKFTEVSSAQASSTGGTQAILIAANASNPFNANIYNNMFSGMDRKATGATAVNQTYIAEIGYGTTKIYNNTFFLPVLSQPTQAGTYNAISYTTANYKADIQNNIFISNEDSKSVLISKPVTSGYTMNNNVYFLRAGNTNARIVDTHATFSAYREANTTLDVNSKNVDVNFADAAAGDLRIAGESVLDINLGMPRLTAVPTDMFGTERAALTYAGAHESAQPFITTGLNAASHDARIIRTETGIRIVLDAPSTIELYTSNGVLVEKAFATDTYNRALNKGVYVVRVNGKSTKFVK